MARIKKEAEESLNESLQATITEETSTKLNDDKTEEVEEISQESNPQTIPDNIDRVLKMYAGYDELYIDKKGGAYTSQYPNTHLYQNPYHKK